MPPACMLPIEAGATDLGLNQKGFLMRRCILVLTLFCAFPVGASAQLAPDSPRLISPNGPGGLGIHFVQADVIPGDDQAVLATWAPPGLPRSLRLRGGFGTGAGDKNAAFGGIDVQAPLTRGREGMPIDLDWQAGAGVGVGDYVLITVPVGLTAGVVWSSGSVWMAPYISAGLAADLRLGDDFEGDEFEVDPALDIGLDLSLDRGRNLVIRGAASLGDRQTLAIGLVLGGGSRTR